MQSNVTLLRLFDLPVFSSVKEFAELAHLDPERVNYIQKSAHRFYKKFTIPKYPTGRREILAPNVEVKAIQAWILRYILDKLKPSDYATAFRQNINLLDNVKPHTSNRYFLCLDLKNFFPSIKYHRVREVFKLIGYSDHASDFLSNLCTAYKTLPQGAITSPALSNLITAKLDRRLAGLCSQKGITFTRYADDITFSCNNPAILKQTFRIIRKIIGSEQFEINKGKIRFSGPSQKCEVTGLTKNSAEPKFSIGRKRIRAIRAEMHRLVTKGEGFRYKHEFQIDGLISYVRMISPQQAVVLETYRNKLRDKYQ